MCASLVGFLAMFLVVLNCKKYNLGAKITRNLGTSSFSLFPLNIQRSKYLAQWSLECSFI